jgi:hypothetical protein
MEQIAYWRKQLVKKFNNLESAMELHCNA